MSIKILDGRASGRERIESRRHYNDGYLYHLDSRNDLFETYRCANRGGMRCRGTVRVEGDGRRVLLIAAHDLHGPNYWSLEEARDKGRAFGTVPDNIGSARTCFLQKQKESTPKYLKNVY